MNRTIVFNHIPKTGGTTLRIILNKVYGEENVYFIKSKDIKASFDEFSSFSLETRAKYKVISGHGANLFVNLVENPFRICVIREPISMFISQYYYLRQSENSNFLKDVKSLDSLNSYIEYALHNGQDNMLTRFMNESHLWLLNQNTYSVQKSDILLAKKSFSNYDAILNLSTFDKGIYSLSQLLSWKRIPLYKRSNKSANDNMKKVSFQDKQFLQKVLIYDIEVYNYFIKNNLDVALQYKPSVTFKLRQYLINKLFN